MFHDDLYQKFLIQDLIESEAMQGRFYTADDFGKQFAEIDLSEHPTRRAEMVLISNNAQTVPQIFFNEDHIGVCTSACSCTC